MKIPMMVLPLVALWSACAMAQDKVAPSNPTIVASISMEPAAQTLLERAKESYKGASGMSYTIVRTRNGKDGGTIKVRYSRPNMLSLDRQSSTYSSKTLIDGSTIYLVSGTEYRKFPAPAGTSATFMSTREEASQIIASLMEGENPLNTVQRLYSGEPFKNFKISQLASLAPRVVDGDVLSGVQYTYSFIMPVEDNDTASSTTQVTAWFGGSPLMLRRVQSRLTYKGKINTISQKIVDQQVSPTFAADAFKFNDTGLKLLTDEEDGEEKSYWDPRLKVGTTPFKFQAKALDSTPVSLDKYKGKVLIMDFWATWCPPCVESVPELKAAYDKYHAKGLEVVGVSLDQDKKALTSFIKAKKMAWPQVFDGDNKKASVADAYGVKAIPFLLIIGKDGKIASVNPRGNIDAAVKAALAAK